jgi:hypothetical protein
MSLSNQVTDNSSPIGISSSVGITKRVYPECVRAFRVNQVGLSPEALSQSPLGILCLVGPGVKGSDRLALFVGSRRPGMGRAGSRGMMGVGASQTELNEALGTRRHARLEVGSQKKQGEMGHGPPRVGARARGWIGIGASGSRRMRRPPQALQRSGSIPRRRKRVTVGSTVVCSSVA